MLALLEAMACVVLMKSPCFVLFVYIYMYIFDKINFTYFLTRWKSN